MHKLFTICLAREDGQILLGLKKRGLGEGKYNGFGGKVEEGETITEAAAREFNQECGLTAKKLEKYGVLEVEFLSDPDIFEIHIFKVEEWEGELKESDEMQPRWFDIEKIPYGRMWPDDEYWLPLFLNSKKFNGKIWFNTKKGQMVKHLIREVDEVILN